MFQVENGDKYFSERHESKDQTPGERIPDSMDLKLLVAEQASDRQAGGFLKSNHHKWGICLPKADPQGQLNKINAVRKQVLEQASETQGAHAALMELAGGHPVMEGSLLPSLLQRMELQTNSSTQFIGYILQIPAYILYYIILIINAAVFLPFQIAQVAVTIVAYPLKIFGDLGKLMRFILAMPLCLVTSILKLVFGFLYSIVNGIFATGTALWGASYWNVSNSTQTYQGSICTLFRNGIFQKDQSMIDAMH